MAIAVRVATAADIERAAQTLALAHHDYEWAVWAFPRTDRALLLRQLFRLDVELGIAAQSVYIDDAADCVAIWSPPKPVQIDMALVQRINDEQDALIGPDGARLAAADQLTHAHRPTVPYWFLGTVGTRPEARGRGLASAVIAPVLERCDREAVVACLETSSEANVRLYERLGFVEVFRTTTNDGTSDGTLPLIVMHRSPAP